MKRVLFLILVAALLSACAQNTALEPAAGSIPTQQATQTVAPKVANAEQSADSSGGAVIVFERSGGFAGKTVQWSLYPDGKVVSGQNTVQTLDQAKVTALVADLKTLGFFDLKDSYGTFSQCKDCYTYTISVKQDGTIKTVSVVEGAKDAPSNLPQIMQKINSTVTLPDK